MSWVTPPLPPVATEPLPLTDDLRDAIDGALAELNAIARIAFAPPIRLAEMDDLPAELVPPGVWGLYANNPRPVIIAQRGLPAFMLRSLIRHELVHWWQDRNGFPPDEGFPTMFGRDDRFRADLQAHMAGLGLDAAPMGWAYRPERDGRGGIAWQLRPRAVVVVHHGAGGFPAAASGVFDSDEAHEHFFIVPDRVHTMIECLVWLRFREFEAPAKSAATSGTLTSDSGGGATSGSGGSSSPTSAGSAHRHIWASFVGATPGGYALDKFRGTDGGGTDHFFDLAVASSSSIETFTEDPSHTHGVTIGSHSHSTPDHQHSVAGHTHGLTYGIFKEPMPASIDVILGCYWKAEVGDAWQLRGSISGIDEEEVLLDLIELVDFDPGLWRLTFLSASGQPQGGRLTVDIHGIALGAIQSS